MPQARLTDSIGRVIGGRYRLVAPLGAGASAEVFAADDVRSDRRVAVKVLHAALAEEASFVKRFRREAQAAAALDHPNVVSVLDWGDDDGVPFLVTELLGGGSLRAVLDRHTLSPAQGLVIGLEATRALEFAHRRGVVHRDIKPANLLLDDDHHLRVADFGLARALAEAALTEPTGAVLGTARYASPEQARGQSVDGRSDVYSLALVIVEAVTGEIPFATDTTIGTLMARVEAVPELDDAVGPLRRSLERALAPDPDQRPDAGEFGISLMAVAEQLDRPAPIPLVPPVLAVSDDALPVSDATEVVDPPDDPTTVVAAPDEDTTPDEVDLVDPDDEAKPTRRRWPVVLAATLLALVLGAGGAYALVQAQVPSFEIPELEGMTEIDARAAVDEFGWRIERREDRELGFDEGVVIRTEPEAGADLDEGDTLLLVVSRGNPLAPVPTGLVGATQDEAVSALADAGFAADVVEVFDEEVEAGVVVRVGVAEGESIPLESEVRVEVSKGPEPRTVPDDLEGTFDEVVARLDDLGLVAERVEVFSDDVEQGRVVGTDPAAGTEVPRDSTVKVQVSKGPDLVEVPDIDGLSLDEATAELERVGLEPGDVFGPAKGEPRSTEPEAGTEVRRGSSVDIYLRR